jgi:hypothetical protein
MTLVNRLKRLKEPAPQAELPPTPPLAPSVPQTVELYGALLPDPKTVPTAAATFRAKLQIEAGAAASAARADAECRRLRAIEPALWQRLNIEDAP